MKIFKKNFYIIIFILSFIPTSISIAIATSDSNIKATSKVFVLASTKPIYNLTAAVLTNKFKLNLLIKGNSSPHSFHLTPADIKLINEANIIIWGGERLEPFLAKIIANKKNNSLIIDITKTKDLTFLPIRKLQTFNIKDASKNSKNNINHPSFGYDAQSDCCKINDSKIHNHTNENYSNHDCTTHSPLHQHKHNSKHLTTNCCTTQDKANFDPHIWLSPNNGKKIAKHIALNISTQFSNCKKEIDNNLQNFKNKLINLDKKNKHHLKQISNKNFLVFHDAFQYFEHYYGLKNYGAITFNPEAPLLAKQLQQIENIIKIGKIHCIFYEPQFNAKIVRLLSEKSQIKKGCINPLGEDKDLGTEGYLRLLENLQINFVKCLK